MNSRPRSANSNGSWIVDSRLRPLEPDQAAFPQARLGLLHAPPPQRGGVARMLL
jgi:hypothetical protein